ncbi:serine--tRNA ligase, mitochondrial isoform X2 [Hyposmocoma kahamanoa]|uniref:serine--tRNA ligase, mitochondrial isoform X2 n=1 Tax=Hyposmocoma kahamanoa TaxID=1477025 RepID=UPI000E6D81FC|nr:serine--tRNA ligase, mitochondrial isoform X2 [Hyposmocoma kahamanoa]
MLSNVAARARNIIKFKRVRLYSAVSFPDIDVDYYCNEQNSEEIKQNIARRKGIGDLQKVLEMYNIYKQTSVTDSKYDIMKRRFYKELSSLPNKTHPSVRDYEEEPRLVHELNDKRDYGSHTPLEFSEITRRLNLMRTDKLGQTCGHKSYYFLGELAELEEALIKYSVSALLNKGFELVSVPDILPSSILESCGMTVNRDRTQIYSLDPLHHGPDLYLSGTAEMSLAGLLMNTLHAKSLLPLKLTAVSRCYRAETSSVLEERGIYRVHQFTKVEMFAVTTPDQSEEMLEYLRETEEELFTPLGIHMRVLDMPPHELGAPAYRKYDIEAWMPGRRNFGEISSCSNCTDYQSRRLHIKYTHNNATKYVHTLNGTACAVPRMLIALLETHQDPKGKISIPKALQPFMNRKKFMSKNSSVPDLKLSKIKK